MQTRLAAALLFPAALAASCGEPIDHRDGIPRVGEARQLRRIYAWRGVPVFIEAGDDERRPDSLWVPYEPGCLFLPYIWGLIEVPCGGGER